MANLPVHCGYYLHSWSQISYTCPDFTTVLIPFKNSYIHIVCSTSAKDNKKFHVAL